MKRRVHAEILKDMQKYIPDFEENAEFYDYESTYGETDPNVIESLRVFYDLHLPVDVTAWIRVNEPDKRLIYANELGKQVWFVRDVICDLLSSTYKRNEKWQGRIPYVISTHYSKSVKLPVYKIDLDKYGIEIIIRDNFYNWVISINSKDPVDFDIMGLFNPDEYYPDIYCEGFPKDKCYGCYSQNHKQFTFELRDEYEVYTYFFLFKNYLQNRG